jgi:hypothetical protein
VAKKTFHWHPRGCDSNGNNGPGPDDRGWKTVTVDAIDEFDYDAAVKALPVTVQQRAANAVRDERDVEECGQCAAGHKCTSYAHYIADKAGMGTSLTLLGEFDWDCLING